MPTGGSNKLTQEKVIEQFKEAHGDEFDYSDVIYVSTGVTVKVRCKKHNYIFHPTPRNHKKGAKCKYCGLDSIKEKLSKGNEKFIQNVIERYGDVYDFSLLKYVNTKTLVTLIHKEYGIVKVRPDTLLCKYTYVNKGNKPTKSTDKNTFIKEAIKVYGDKDDYTYTNIISSKENIDIRCRVHNITFNKSIQTYLAGWGCPSCSAENYRRLRAMPKEEYYFKANEKHSNKYSYIDDYTTPQGVITFVCPQHGKQRKNAGSHLSGYGCKKCEIEPQKINKRTKEGYCKLANGRDTKLYIIRCFNEKENFYKVGKTFREIKKRYVASTIPYEIEVIYEYTNSAEIIWDLEEALHKKYKEFKYNPKKWFSGYSESYLMNLPIERIIKQSELCQKE